MKIIDISNNIPTTAEVESKVKQIEGRILEDSRTLNQNVLQPIIKIAELIELILEGCKYLFEKSATVIGNLRKNHLDDAIVQVGELFLERKIAKTISGVNLDWLRLCVINEDVNVWVKNNDGIFVAINKKFLDLLSLENSGAILGNKIEDVKISESESNSLHIKNLLMTLQPKINKDKVTSYVAEDGSYKVIKYPIVFNNKKVGLVGILIEKDEVDQHIDDNEITILREAIEDDINEFLK